MDLSLWADIVPQSALSCENELVNICYESDYLNLMNVFRAIIARQEKSDRALMLTTAIIELNAQFYAAWIYRKQILDFLANVKSSQKEEEEEDNVGDDENPVLDNIWTKEIRWLDILTMENLKNYQVWQHRQMIICKLSSVTYAEIEFLESLLEIDSKNYHLWAYRIWLVQEYGLWDGELNKTTKHIEADALNNSAWNYRYFVIRNCPLYKSNTSFLQQEIKFTKKWIKQYPSNMSSIQYLNNIQVNNKKP